MAVFGDACADRVATARSNNCSPLRGRADAPDDNEAYQALVAKVELDPHLTHE